MHPATAKAIHIPVLFKEGKNLLTAQMSKNKAVLLIRIYQHLLHEMSVVFTVIYQGTCNACVHLGSSLNSVSAYSAT